MPALRNAFTRVQDAFVADTRSRTRSIRAVWCDLVEAGLDVTFHDPLVTAWSRREVAHLGDRVMGPALRAEPVGTREEIRLENRLQHQFQGSPGPPGR